MTLNTSDSHHHALTRRRVLQAAAAIGFTAATPSVVRAQTYPSGPITVIINVPAGGVLDVLARGASDQARKDMGQPFVIENIPGGTSNIGAARVARAKPDGMTVLLTVSSPIVTNVLLMKDMPFNPDNDLAPVIITAQSPLALAVHKSVPIRTLQEYIAYAKANPGKLTCGNSGPGSPHHLGAEFLASLTGIKLNHVPYKGSPASIADLVGGHVQSAVVALGGIMAQAKAGDVRILALTDDQRTPLASEIPTIGEIVPGFKYSPAAWNGMFVPANTPREIINKLNATMNAALKDPELSSKLKNVYLSPVGGTPEALAEKIKGERKVAQELIAKLGLKTQ
jgi:tripartite-type tricarboxylate transporter receptor subunit TctC